jgi:hypothetical protein
VRYRIPKYGVESLDKSDVSLADVRTQVFGIILRDTAQAARHHRARGLRLLFSFVVLDSVQAVLGNFEEAQELVEDVE